MRFLLCCSAVCLALVSVERVMAQDAVAMIVDLIGRDDAEYRAIGLDRVRHAAKGSEATRAFSGLLATQQPGRQAELLAALADRGDKAALPAITTLLPTATAAEVRTAAVRALGLLGGPAEVEQLLKSLTAADPEKSAARRALVVLPGADSDKRLVEAAASGSAAVRPVLIDILADRRTRSALPTLLAAATDADAGVRSAAMRALGRLGGPDEVPGMVKGYLAAQAGAERNDAERALVTVCTESRGKEQSATAFLAAFEASAGADRETLLSPLGRIGGSAALAIVDGLLADPAKRDLGMKALTRWPDATVVPKLLDMLGKSQNPAEREMLLGALIRIAPLPDNKLNDKQKLDLVQKIMPLCQTDEERAKLLERANAIRTVETFRFVLPYVDQPALAEPACKSVVELAHHRQLRDAHKEEFTKALDKVIATTKNPEFVDRANRYKEGKTWERK
ncbi:MAG: HEAT repeat domain-containing protein [Planctomycetia bacterium]